MPSTSKQLLQPLTRCASPSILIALLMTATVVLAAPTAAQERGETPAPLTDSDVTGYAGAMIDLAKLAEEHRERWEEIAAEYDDKDAASGAEAMKMWADFVGGSATRDDYVAIISRHGFESEAEFQQKAERILTVYSAIKTSEAQPEMQQSLSQMMQRLEGSGLSDDQKAEMKKAFEEAQGRLRDFQDGVSDRDRATVNRHLSLIEETFEKLRTSGS